jgi:hypothetical protein
MTKFERHHLLQELETQGVKKATLCVTAGGSWEEGREGYRGGRVPKLLKNRKLQDDLFLYSSMNFLQDVRSASFYILKFFPDDVFFSENYRIHSVPHLHSDMAAQFFECSFYSFMKLFYPNPELTS